MFRVLAKSAAKTQSAVSLAAKANQMNVMQQMRFFAMITKYTKTHEYIFYNTDTKLAKIGITDFA